MRNEVDQSERRNLLCDRTGLANMKNMRRARMASCFGLLICAVFSSTSARAESIDGMRVLSALNEPLRAQLVLHGNSRLQQRCAKAGIESMEGESIGAADVRIADDGKTQTLTLATQEAIREPAVNVVVQTGCDSQEEHIYPVLLDLVRPEGSAASTHIPVVSDSTKTPAAIDAPQREQNPSESRLEEGAKLQLTRSLSALNLLAVDMDVAAASTINRGDSVTQSLRKGNAAPVEADASGEQAAVAAEEGGAHNWMHRHWRSVLGICAVLLSMLMLSFWRSAHRAKHYALRRAVKRAPTTQIKTPMKAGLSPAALDPIPYAKPDMTLIASLNTVPPRPSAKRESKSANPAPAATSVAQVGNRIAEDPNARPPLYSAEEVVDETQLAKLCMGLNQPLRAIEILEVYWGQKQPNTPLPWQYLLELYRSTGDLNKYRELIGRFNSAFGDPADKRVERVERTAENHHQYEALPEEIRRMRA